MTTVTTDLPSANPHQEIEELLPWYINRTLSPVERRMVEQHLEQYPAFRAELEHCHALAVQYRETITETWRPPAGHFDRLMADIDRLPPSVQIKVGPTLSQRVLAWLRATPTPVRWILSIESLAVAVLVVFLLPSAMPPVEPGYETLSVGVSPTAAKAPRLRVVFAESMTVSELGALLRDIGGQIVTGPTLLGVYTIAVTGGDQSGEASRVVTTLRAHPHVRLAEPLEPN